MLIACIVRLSFHYVFVICCAGRLGFYAEFYTLDLSSRLVIIYMLQAGPDCILCTSFCMRFVPDVYILNSWRNLTSFLSALPTGLLLSWFSFCFLPCWFAQHYLCIAALAHLFYSCSQDPAIETRSSDWLSFAAWAIELTALVLCFRIGNASRDLVSFCELHPLTSCRNFLTF